MSENGSATEATKKTPAYVAFQTLDNFVARLNANGVPNHIDKHMMDNLSGAVQSHLISALRFLGLIEGRKCVVTAALEKLVESYGTDGYREALAEIIDHAYSDIIGDIDIAKANAKQVDEAFSSLDGDMRERAIRFYLKALSTSGATISQYLGKRKARGTANASKPRKPKVATAAAGKSKDEKRHDDREAEDDAVPDGLVEFPIPLGVKGACIRVPMNITSKQIPLVRAIFSAVEAMATQNSGE